MPKQRRRVAMIEGLIIMPNKNRKRGCSSSSSVSSRIRSCRLNKRAILVGKNRARKGDSRTGTPVPIWRTTPLRNTVNSPKYPQSGKSTQPVSARRLAATLWEMNEIPSPKMSVSNFGPMKQLQNRNGSKMYHRTEKMQSGLGPLSGLGSLPPHLLDPSNAASENMDRSGTSSHHRIPLISQRHRYAEKDAAKFDSVSHTSFMEVETRSRPLTSSGSLSGMKNRLKDVSHALSTSKELLKIIDRLWTRADQSSSSMSVISTLHAELERARLQVNHLIKEHRTYQNEISYLVNYFAEEKASWRSKEHQAIEAAIAAVAGELEVERRLRRRLDSLNKKLGSELTEMKSSFLKTVRELEREKRTREITEQMCDELARNIDEDRGIEKLKTESVLVDQDAEKEMLMLKLADKLLQERVHIKNSRIKHHSEEKYSAIGKMRKQLEGFLGAKRDKHDDRSNISNYYMEQKDDEETEEYAADSKAGSTVSDFHSIELNMRNDKKDEIKARNSLSGQVSWRTFPLQRSVSNGLEWGSQNAGHQNRAECLDRQRFLESEKEPQRRRSHDDAQRSNVAKRLKDHMISSSWLPSARNCNRPSNQVGGSESRVMDIRGGEGQDTRKSQW